jgi:hypothetical protein
LALTLVARDGLAFRPNALHCIPMLRPSNVCVLLASVALIGGVLTLQVGQARGVAIVELLLAILYAALSLRSRRDD